MHEGGGVRSDPTRLAEGHQRTGDGAARAVGVKARGRALPEIAGLPVDDAGDLVERQLPLGAAPAVAVEDAGAVVPGEEPQLLRQFEGIVAEIAPAVAGALPGEAFDLGDDGRTDRAAAGSLEISSPTAHIHCHRDISPG